MNRDLDTSDLEFVQLTPVGEAVAKLLHKRGELLRLARRTIAERDYQRGLVAQVKAYSWDTWREVERLRARVSELRELEGKLAAAEARAAAAEARVKELEQALAEKWTTPDMAAHWAAAERAAILEHGDRCLANGYSLDECLSDIESLAHHAAVKEGT